MKQPLSSFDLPKIPKAQIAIIQSKWHQEVSDSMVEKCCQVLASAGVPEPERHLLPGSLELPLAARHLLNNNQKLEAIIAFGIIIKGETDHYEVVRDNCISGLAETSLLFEVPVIIEVLPVLDMAQAKARCADDEFNKGIEAAKAAVEMIHWCRANRPK